ncbi:leader peptidase (prepilin peptidase)/N-methyltransferase [Nitrospina gracilis]|uniref:prepilin peptidase n=2 Tax=Nitrospina TaxID=35800 RepID=UPI001F2190FD|nr:A24 family peptidase [Nitrospina sp. Nb-3]MCF8722072.1 leader peptidase (prepilin peptidase)/N-methyltransferase [Nitrospina sp. Nb-3]
MDFSTFALIPPPLLAGIGFLFGLVIGSFCNVCIARLPRKESVAFPASHCPHCKTPIRKRDNIPVLSYLILGGRCRKCKERISPVYPAVELVTALLWAGVLYKFGFTWTSAIFAIVMPTLVIITVIDIQHQIIPDKITLPGIAFGLVAGTYLNGFMDSLIGLVVGGGLFLFLAEVYFKVRGAMGMGGGDIKYIAAAGALLGWAQVLLVIFLGAISGALFGALGMTTKKLNFLSRIPFGPFLALATVISIFFGDDILGLYLSLMVVEQ